MENEKFIHKIKEWHSYVVIGLVNGLSHTARDGRLKEVEFWQRRSNLFNAFAHCVNNLITNQTYEYSEKELMDIAKAGYKLGEDRV